MTGPDPVTAFDLAGRLPTGTTVLEASAGTGKTYTIAGLVTRWVAETPLRLPQLLVVTFTRAATAELRDRVRRRLVDAADHLEATAAGTAKDTDDPVLRLLADATTDEAQRRRARIVRALSDIDAATIATIHGFCQHVLDGLGIASDLDRDAELVENHTELIEEVVDDLLVTTYLDPTDRPRVTRDDLLTVGRAVVGNPTTALAPRSPDDPAAGIRLHLAQRIRAEVTRRCRRRRQMSYDDLLTRLEATVRDPIRGPAARGALRDRYRVTLIDEFQDTDPIQWSIVSQAFTDPEEPPRDGRAVVLIGDPKQAIYAFRGADVYAYLDASGEAAVRYTLPTNWRSDAALLDALHALLDGAEFGDEDIVYRPVRAAAGHDQPRLLGAPHRAALRLRLLPCYDHLGEWRGKITAGPARDVIARDVAADIVELLAARPARLHRDGHGDVVSSETVAPGDIAVLVRSNAEATLVQDALRRVDVPAVVSGVESVFTTPAATDWRRLLDALERPASASRVRALALTTWIGWTADDVARADEDAWNRVHDDVHRWADLLRDDGVATAHRAVLLQRDVQLRMLTRKGGERHLADLEHIGELLHAAAAAEHLGVPALAGWLRQRMVDAADDSQDERLRRLETDDEAVQILTIHRSKGLEFPVVYCPFLWSSSTGVRGVPIFHDTDRQRRIDVGGDQHDQYDANRAAAEREARGEELRLAYVAMTRARHQVVAWYAPAGQPEWSGLGRLLLCRDDDGRAQTHLQAPLPDDTQIVAAARAVAARSDGTVSVETVPADPSDAPWTAGEPPSTTLERAQFTRTLDGAWRRTSYSGLTSLDLPSPAVSSEDDEKIKDDEAAVDDVVAAAPAADPSDRPDGAAVPLATMPGGRHVGTLVHAILEHTDFAADDLDGELEHRIGDQLERSGLDIDATTLRRGLRAAIETPLGLRLGGLRLRDVAPPDRRDEIDFELPLDRDAGGRTATLADVADLLRTHLPDDDPLAGYPDGLPRPLAYRRLRGYLGGSIDLVVRRTAYDGTPTFHAIDHKTNRLSRDQHLTAWHYRPDALADAMIHGHYPLQALLYSVALHRMLRWRLPDYDPARNLGDVTYLFLRGMVGPDTPTVDGHPHGVFTWALPPSLIVATSDLLHGTRR